MIHIKTDKEIAKMRQSGRLLAQSLEEVKAAVRPGITLVFLDRIAKKAISKRNATPSFKGDISGAPSSKNTPPFPSHLCTSVNSELIHAPANRDIVLQEGDIVELVSPKAAALRAWVNIDDQAPASSIPMGPLARRAQRAEPAEKVWVRPLQRAVDNTQ